MDVEKVNLWTYKMMCGFALTISLSMAASNVFLALSILAFFYRLWLKHDDVITFYNKYSTILKLLGVLMLTVVVSSLLSGEPSYSLKVAADFYLYRIMPFFIIWFVTKTQRQLLILVLLIFASMVFNAFAAIGQFYIVDHYTVDFIDRFSGLIPYMAEATQLTVAVPLVAIAAVHYKKYRGILVFSLLILIAAFFFNMTRGAWLSSLAVLIVLIFIYGKNIKPVIAVLAAFVCFGYLLYSNVPKIEARVNTIAVYNIADTERMKLIHSAYNMWNDNKIFGIGFGRFKLDYKEKYMLPDATEKHLEHAHNNFMHVLAETGVVGELAFLAFWGYLLFFAFKNWRLTKNPYAFFMLAIILAVHLHGLSEYTLGASRTIKFTYFALGIALTGLDEGRS